MTLGRALIGVGFFSGGWYALNQYYYLLEVLGGFMSLLVLGVVAVPLFLLGGWLKDHESPWMREVGAVYLTVYEYTALLQGTVLTVIVFWSVLYSVGELELPDTHHAFLVDFFPGLGLFSAMIYGSAAGMEAKFNDDEGTRRVAAVLCVLTCVLPLVAYFGVDDLLSGFAQASPGLYVMSWLLYLVVGSTAIMRVSR